MSAQTIFLIFFGGGAVWFGIVVFRTHSMVRSALALLFSQTLIGAMFLVMQAEFLGVLQIMMMATEMSVMAIFMVMFMMDPGGLGAMEMTHQKRLSLWAGGIGFVGALAVIFLADWGELATNVPTAARQTELLGIELLERSMFIFQSAGLTILTAMIAATMVAISPLQKAEPAPTGKQGEHAHDS
jgi:NADH-quinone oxidoreductase subunit J